MNPYNGILQSVTDAYVELMSIEGPEPEDAIRAVEVAMGKVALLAVDADAAEKTDAAI